MVKGCFIPGCPSITSDPSISFHGFPKDPKFRQAWMKSIKHETILFKTIPQASSICSKHFLDSDFKETRRSGNKRRILKDNAVPSLFLYSSSVTTDYQLPSVLRSECTESNISHDDKVTESKPPLLEESKQPILEESKMPASNKVLSFSEKLGQWLITDENTDKTSTAEISSWPVSVKVEKPDIENTDAVTLLSDLPRNSSSDKENLSFDSSSAKEAISTTNMLVTVKEEPMDDDIPSVETSNNASENNQSIPFSYEELEKHLGNVCKPNSWWTVSSLPAYVVCTKWSDSFTCDRKVVITKDLTVKVYWHKKELPIDREINSFESVSSLLSLVDEL